MDLFSKIAAVTLLAAVLVWTVQKLRQSAVVAYLALGVLVGPSVFGIMPSGEAVEHFSEIGVILLLFFIGLEFHFEALKSMLRFATLGTLTQIVLTAAGTGGGCLALGLRPTESLVVGIAMALSSTAIVMKSFEERRESDSTTAYASLAILLGQDIAALLVVAALPLVLPPDPESSSGLPPAATFGIMIVALPTLFLVGRRALPWAFRTLAVARNQEAFALCSLGACLAVAVLAQRAGASPALGAFLAGLVLSDSPYSHQIRADLTTVKNLALAFFFVTVGMLMDLAYVTSHLPLMVFGLVVVVALKTVLGAITFRLFRFPWSIAAGGGLALSQVGEFAFVLAAATKKGGLLGNDAHQLLIALSVLTMLVAPALVSRSRTFGQWVSRRLGGGAEPPAPVKPAPRGHTAKTGTVDKAPPTRAIVVGYGPVGRTLCKILIRFGVRPCVVELKLDTVQRLQSMGRDAIFGDAGRREILLAAGVAEARYLIITLPDFASRAPIITSARAINPSVMIMSRARYLDERKGLEQAGASHVSYEECEVAAELARHLLSELDVREDLVDHELARVRSEIAVRSGFTVILQRPTNAPAGATSLFRIHPTDEAKPQDAAPGDEDEPRSE